MEKLTRRGLFKRVSLGAGATGALATAVAVGAHFGSASLATTENTPATSGQNTGSTNLSDSSSPSSDPMVVLTNPGDGTLLLMSGERELTVQNHTLVQTLSALMK